MRWITAWVNSATTKMESHGVWRGAGWGIATMCLIDGVVFLVFGNAAAGGPSYSLMERAPFGMRLIGFFMTAVALGLFATVHRRDRSSLIALYLTFTLGVFIISYTIGGWINSDKVAISTMSKWFLLTWLSLWLAITTWRGRGGPHDKSAR